jgi:hypothetical protein
LVERIGDAGGRHGRFGDERLASRRILERSRGAPAIVLPANQSRYPRIARS